MNWYAMQVKSRHEFVTNSELARKDIETFVPAVRRQRQWKDRKKWVEFPLFPGYVFVHLQPAAEEFLSAVRTRGAVRLLSAEPGCPTPVAPEEIASLKIMMDSGQDFDIYPHLKEGSPVRVRRGPLAGAQGVLRTKDGQHLFGVNIELLGRSVAVKICAEDLEAA